MSNLFTVSTVFTVIEIIGVLSFSISGAIMAIDKENDIFGVVFLSIITCFGGGIMRDITMGKTPLFFTSYVLLITTLVASLLVFTLATIFKKQYVENEALVNSVNNYIDAAGLGVFVVSGVKICISYGATNPLLIIIMGVLSGTGGSILRDVIMREIPYVLRKRIYVLAALAGVCLYYLFYTLGVEDVIAMPISALAVFAIRVCATIFKWNMPKAIDFAKLRSENENDRIK